MRAGGHKGWASWEMICGKVSAMLNAHYRTCNLTSKHGCVISHTHSRTCTLPRKCYDYSYLRAAIASLSKGERSGRCSLGLLLHTGPTSMGNGSCSLGLHLHTGATSTGNVSGWPSSQSHIAMSAGNAQGERSQTRGSEVLQKVIPNPSPVNRQSKWDWRSNLNNEISEERQKEAHQLVCTTRRARVSVRQTLPSHQEVEEWARLAENVNYAQPRYTGVAVFRGRTTRHPQKSLSLVPLLLLESEERGTANARWRLRQLLHLMYMRRNKCWARESEQN